MADTRTCPNCGHVEPRKANFCSECQTPLTEAQTPGAPAHPGVQQRAGTVSGVMLGQGNIGTININQAPGAAAAYQPEPLPPAGRLPDPGKLPPGSRLTLPRNAAFTGRVPDLLALAEALFYQHSGPWAVTQAIAGLGGVGKTQLAAELAYRYGRFTQGAHWINAAGTAEQNNIEAEIAACGLALGLPGWPETQPEQVAATLSAWQRQPERLVVLDNLEDPGLLRPWLARLAGVRLLVTSRRRSWPADLGLCSRPLDTLPRPESLALLRALAPRLQALPDEEPERLAERLCDLPLALHLAGSYLQRVRHSPRAYLEALEHAGGALKYQPLPDSMKDSPTEHDLRLFETFQVSWLQLHPDDPNDRLARGLFRACGYCAPNVDLPLAVLAELHTPGDAATEPEPGSGFWARAKRRLGIGARSPGAARPVGGAPSQGEIDLALSRLYELGLAEAGEAGPRLHPLLAELARLLDAAETESALPALAHALARVSYQALETGLPQDFLGLRPHLPVAAAAAEQAGLQYAGALWNNLGAHQNMIADYSGAKAAYERALRIDEAAFGLDHPDVANYVNNLGWVLNAQGDLAGARAHYERALRIWEQQLGPDHPQVAAGLNNLGGVLRDQGDLAGARAHHERALRILEQQLGPDHPQVAAGLNNLGLVLQDLSDLAGARAHYERALRIDEAAFGPDHPEVARDVNNVGGVLRDLGDLRGARAHHERALRIWEQQLGPDHPQVATGLNNLGLVLQDLGDLPGARAHFERALRIAEKELGPDHPYVATSNNNLGRVLRDQGDLTGARAHYERALRILAKTLPPDHPYIRITKDNLASLP
jgi:tetratricopeptide (TPR) repeat protein